VADRAAIERTAKSYVNRVPYRWGGANPRGWDCSGFVNYVLCHDLGYNIPGYRGGTFTGAVHGPSTYSWAGWSGMSWVARASVQAGDIVLWASHMGIAVGPNYYVSAYDTQLGTVIEPIHGGGPYGETASFWNLRQGAASTRPQGGSGGSGVGGRIPGGNPASGTAWDNMQHDWNLLRGALGTDHAAYLRTYTGLIGKANRVGRS